MRRRVRALGMRLASVGHRGVVPCAEGLGLLVVHGVDEEALVRLGSRQDHRDGRPRHVHAGVADAKFVAPVALLRGRRLDAVDDAGVLAAARDRAVRIHGRDRQSENRDRHDRDRHRDASCHRGFKTACRIVMQDPGT